MHAQHQWKQAPYYTRIGQLQRKIATCLFFSCMQKFCHMSKHVIWCWIKMAELHIHDWEKNGRPCVFASIRGAFRCAKEKGIQHILRAGINHGMKQSWQRSRQLIIVVSLFKKGVPKVEGSRTGILSIKIPAFWPCANYGILQSCGFPMVRFRVINEGTYFNLTQLTHQGIT